MAKTTHKQPAIRTGGDGLSPYPSKIDREEKRDGACYELTLPLDIERIPRIIGVGGKLRECLDGFFSVYDERGGVTFFRVGPQIIDQLKLENKIIKI